MMKTQVGIVGAGPAGLFLSHLLKRNGIESVIIEAKSRQYCEERVRAGVLEQKTVDLMIELGVGERMQKICMPHCGVGFRFHNQHHRIDLQELTGKAITVYAQHEIVKDLVEARLAQGDPILWEAEAMELKDIDTDRPRILYKENGQPREIECDFIAGCDGFHGIARPAIPAGVLKEFDKVYPFSWLGILAQAAPASEEVSYACQDRGFALMSMRSPEISRLYIQVDNTEKLEDWPDDRIWAELQDRCRVSNAPPLNEGPVIQKNIAPLRSYVAEPMQYGRLFLAGDAAHIVPPTGAKGLNLAAADVMVLERGLVDFYKHNQRDMLDRYSSICLRHGWKVQRFSWWMTQMLHHFPEDSAFDRRRRLAELDYLLSSPMAAKAMAENYAGLDVIY